MAENRTYTLVVSCPDRVGIVAAVSTFIAGNKGWILESNYHADRETQRFFMRNVIQADSLPFTIDEFRKLFAPIAVEFGMDWRIADSAVKPRVVLLCSKQAHCLVDLLHRWRAKDFAFDVPCVISNHTDLKAFTEFHGIPYFHVPVGPANKAAHYAEVERLFRQHNGDVMVLARYMQILPSEVTRRYPGRIINIHHSFLPAFIGAKPYHQAFERGVKLIGATCHYVTEDLDEGPIIEQDVVRVDHGDTAEDFVRYGKEVERSVLARGLRYHLEDRVLLNGHRTVVFR
jgi:formyltetrahydrofolate deformylase